MITLKRGTELNQEAIKKILAKKVDYTENQKYYMGDQKIEDRIMTDITKPNNKLVNANAAYITDVNVGYFMGQPVSYGSTNKPFMTRVQEIFDLNDEQDENVQLAQDASIYGVAYELMYMDEDSKIRFNRIHPGNMIVIYDTKITPVPWAAIRVYADGDEDIYLEIYTDTTITLYKTDKEVSQFALQGTPASNPFGVVPVNVFPNNDTYQGDFDKVKSLIDEYDKAQSDTANDFEYFTDAYLHIHNMNLGEQDIKELKEKRVLQTEGEAAGSIEWVIKEIQDIATENFKKRLQEDIHRFSKTPNLTDESFAGNLSGIALSYKLLGMEWAASTKERKFKKGLQNRLMLIAAMLTIKGTTYDYTEIKMEFTRNLPQNAAEIIEMLVSLAGRISEETFLTQIPFIDDPAKEQENMDEEAKANALRTNPRGGIDLDETPEVVEE